MPAKRRDAGGEIGDRAHLDRHAAFVIGIEPHAAHAACVKRRQFVIADVHGDRHHGAGAVRGFGIERRHAVENGGIVDAVDGGLGEHHAVDAERFVQVLEIGERRIRRIVTAVRGQLVAGLEDVNVGVDRAPGQGQFRLVRISIGRQAIADVFGHRYPGDKRRLVGGDGLEPPNRPRLTFSAVACRMATCAPQSNARATIHGVIVRESGRSSNHRTSIGGRHQYNRRDRVLDRPVKPDDDRLGMAKGRSHNAGAAGTAGSKSAVADFDTS